MDNLDWRWLKSFIAVAEAKNMQEAARRSGTSQPTLSRHIQQLEETLNLRLFERTGRNLILSPQGSGLLERATQVKGAIKAFERQALGLSTEEAGIVRLTMAVYFGCTFAPHWLRAFQQDHPHISMDIVTDDAELNLLMREAEIAIRLFKPTQLELKTSYCGALPLGFFASQTYLDRRGIPTHLDDLRAHDLIGYDRIMTWLNTARNMGYDFKREDFVCRTDEMILQQHMAEQGIGIVVLPTPLAKRYTKLIHLFDGLEMPGQPIYLTAAPDLHQNPRMLKVWRHLSIWLKDLTGHQPIEGQAQ